MGVITRAELNPHGYELTPQQKRNFEFLFVSMNALRFEYGRPMYITSGVRSVEDQKRINPKHMNDAHVQAAACDVQDTGRAVWEYCVGRLDLIQRLGLYLEAKSYTPEWVHFQVIAPKSGLRIFIP